MSENVEPELETLSFTDVSLSFVMCILALCHINYTLFFVIIGTLLSHCHLPLPQTCTAAPPPQYRTGIKATNPLVLSATEQSKALDAISFAQSTVHSTSEGIHGERQEEENS